MYFLYGTVYSARPGGTGKGRRRKRGKSFLKGTMKVKNKCFSTNYMYELNFSYNEKTSFNSYFYEIRPDAIRYYFLQVFSDGVSHTVSL